MIVHKIVNPYEWAAAASTWADRLPEWISRTLFHLPICNKEKLHSSRTGNGSDLSLWANLQKDRIRVTVTAGVSVIYSSPWAFYSHEEQMYLQVFKGKDSNIFFGMCIIPLWGLLPLGFFNPLISPFFYLEVSMRVIRKLNNIKNKLKCFLPPGFIFPSPQPDEH